MADERMIMLANKVYQTLCDAIERRNWKYDKDEENLRVRFDVMGEDIPMRIGLAIDVERQLVRLFSPLPFSMGESKRLEGAVAACVATYGLADGSFSYDITDGTFTFKMTASFRESIVGEELLQYMISYAASLVDKYNDRFLALEKGTIGIADFIAAG